MRYQKKQKAIVIFTALLFHSLLIFHLLFSPVIIVLASSKGIVNASFFSFVLIFVLSLFFGRAYCAWFCPGCGVQEIAGFLIKKKAKNTNAKYIKYLVSVVWIFAIVTGYIRRGFTQIDLSYGMLNISTGQKLIMTVGAIAIIVPLAVVFGTFASCKYICWQAPLMVVGKRIRDMLRLPGLRIKTDTNNCKNCGACNRNCPMSIDVVKKIPEGEIIDDECILCGSCIDACRFDVLCFRVSIPKHKSAPQ